MSYTLLTLFGLGLLGVVLHNLVKLNDIKRANPNGDVNYGKYFKMESISIIISIIVIAALTWTSQEIKELANAGKWLGLGFVAAGYLAQSLLIKFMGKAQKVLDAKTDA